MDAVLNILVLGFAALIAYWWANQGLFSAMLHLACVIAAGALAFATWEPASEALLGVGGLQAYAWGIGLLLPFALYLLVLRIAADKLAPDNLNFPHWANLGLGGVLGACAAVLTVGISLIGMGHTHSTADLLGVKGAARSSSTKGQPNLNATALWVPMHTITANFYAKLSNGAFAPTLQSATLATQYPNLAQQSLGLHRDTYNRNGKLARTAATPGSITIGKAILVPDVTLPDGTTTSAYVVDVHFDAGASTEGQGFAISSSQLRLIGAPDAKASGVPPVAYPAAWAQPNSGGGRTVFMFDDIGAYISSPPGTQMVDATLIYPAGPFASAPPKFLHALGLRIPFPAVGQQATMADASAMLLGGGSGGVQVPGNTPLISPEDLVINDTIMPANADLNNLGAMEVKDTNYLFSGIGEYEQGGFRGSKSVIVKGIWAPPNTRVVRLNIARGNSSSIDVWNDRSKVRSRVGDDANLALVDDLGRMYFPIGFIHAVASGDRRVSIKLQRDGAYYKIGTFPNQPSSGADKLFALFTPAVGRKIVGVKLGDEWIAASDLDIKPAS